MISLMEIDGGYIPSDENRHNHYQKVSEVKQRDLSRSMRFAQIDMNKHLVNAQNCLKKVDTVETRSKIEMEKYGNTSTSVALSHYKRLAAYNFFVTMIGYIDSKIKYERERIEFASHFTICDDLNDERSHYDEIELRKGIIAGYLVDREEILDDFKSYIGNDYETNEIIDNVLRDAPSYLKFNRLYENCEKDTGKIELISNLVNAYNIGLLTNDYYGTKNNYENRIYGYRQLYSDLTVHINTNSAELKNVKSKKKK